MSAWSNSMLLMTAISGRMHEELRRLVEERAVVLVAFDDEVATDTRLRPMARARSDPPKLSAMPPTSIVGSRPPCVSSQPVSDVVVVLPWVPARTIDVHPTGSDRGSLPGSEQ